MNDWALITGASSGIGLELAKLFAADHWNLILVARNQTRLRQVASELSAVQRVTVRTIAKDLAGAQAPAEIFEAARDIKLGCLVNNAGFGAAGAFAEAQRQTALAMMQVNMNTLVDLTQMCLKPMRERRHGRILNVASTAAFQPGPCTALYYATKAFVFSFSVALAEELSGTGITVTTLCPGYTITEFHQRAGMNRSARWIPRMTAQQVAKAGYRGMMDGKGIIIPGMVNWITAAFARRLPIRMTARMVQRINGH